MVQPAARSLGPHDLVLSHFSLAPGHPVADRVAAAAAAGFAGIGLHTGQYRALEAAGDAPGRLDDLLAEHGICLAEIEVVRGWARRGGGDPVGRTDEAEAAAWRMADAFGCRSLQAIGPYDGTLDDAGAAFAGLCDRAADHGLVVGLEFLPFTNIAGALDALAIVERAGRDNGGVCIDVWHHARGDDDVEALRAIPGDRVTAVQLNDGPRRPDGGDYYRDCIENRRPPGHGDFGVVDLVRMFRAMGVAVPWSVEVCAISAWEEPEATGTAHRLAHATRAVLEAAWDQPASP